MSNGVRVDVPECEGRCPRIDTVSDCPKINTVSQLFWDRSTVGQADCSSTHISRLFTILTVLKVQYIDVFRDLPVIADKMRDGFVLAKFWYYARCHFFTSSSSVSSSSKYKCNEHEGLKMFCNMLVMFCGSERYNNTYKHRPRLQGFLPRQRCAH